MGTIKEKREFVSECMAMDTLASNRSPREFRYFHDQVLSNRTVKDFQLAEKLLETAKHFEHLVHIRGTKSRCN